MSSRRSEVNFDDRRERDYGVRYSRYDDDYDDRQIEFRRSRPPPEVIERDRSQVRIIEESRVPAYVRNESGRPPSGPVVLRAREREDYEYAPRRRSPPRGGEETVIYRREREESRPPPPERETEQLVVRTEKVDNDDRRSRRGDPGRSSEKDLEIVITHDKSDSPPRHSSHSVARPRSRERERERSTARHSRRGSDSETEITFRRDQREGRRGNRESSQVVIRHSSRSSSPARSERPPEPQIINAPQIHQEVITHHRHIDHGYEVSIPARRPMSRPPSPPSPPRSRSRDRIAIHRSGERDGRPYHDDLVIDRHEDDRDSPLPRDHYDRYPRPRDWPEARDSRESEEIIWKRSNGPRRHEDELDIYINHDVDRYPPPAPMRENRGEIGGRYGRAKNPTDGLWTEITKDLVVKEAIEEMGYEYEETDEFYYIIAYLKYEDIVHLTGLSEDIRKDRRERVKQIEWENRVAPEPEEPAKPRLEIEGPPPRSKSPWNSENERYIEREIVYRGGRPPPPPGWRR